MIQRLGVFGSTGRMGQRVLALAQADPEIEVVATPGRDAKPGAFDSCDVVIDFSVAAGTGALLRALVGTDAALVTGATGRLPQQQAAVVERSQVSPLFTAANFSVGVALLTILVERAVQAMPNADVEVFEMHHRRKADAPSGTALHLARTAAEARGWGWPAGRGAPREQAGPRGDEEVGLAAVRGGDIVGEHTVFLIDAFERIELVHRAGDRDLFAAGALRAAKWLVDKAPGHYGMRDLVAV